MAVRCKSRASTVLPSCHAYRQWFACPTSQSVCHSYFCCFICKMYVEDCVTAVLAYRGICLTIGYILTINTLTLRQPFNCQLATLYTKSK